MNGGETARSGARAAIAGAALAIVGATGCRPTIPPCDADPLRSDEPSASGFLVAPIVRVEAVDVIEAARLPALVATELYLGAPSAGATIGYAHFDGDPGLAVGTSLFRFGGGVKLAGGPDWRTSYLLPDANLRMSFVLGPGDPVMWASATSDLVGLRIARCLGEDACFHAALRGPTIGPAIFLMEPEINRPSSRPLGALVLGGTVEAGFAF
jgi:hypothetical protein